MLGLLALFLELLDLGTNVVVLLHDVKVHDIVLVTVVLTEVLLPLGLLPLPLLLIRVRVRDSINKVVTVSVKCPLCHLLVLLVVVELA